MLLCVGIAGCHRKVVFKIPQGALVPVELEDSSSDESSATIAPLEPPDLGELPTPSFPPPVQRRRPSPSPREEPTQSGGESVPATVAIGMLSSGSDATPQVQQQTQDMISSTAKRVAALSSRVSSRVANSQKQQIGQVRHFLEQAQQALTTGDAQGAKNLATKAGLLMDDLEKK